jgi:hypothetical protein
MASLRAQSRAPPAAEALGARLQVSGDAPALSDELWLVGFESRTVELGHAWLSTKRREGQGMRASGASSPT